MKGALGKVSLFALAVLLFGGLIAFAWTRLGSEAQDKGPSERVARVERRDIVVKELVQGTLQAANQVEIKAKVGGQLEKLYVEEGDQVKPGDLLAQIETTELRQALRRAEANLAIAQAEFERVKAGDPTSRRIATEAELKTARQQLKTAEENLKRLEELHQKGYVTDQELDQAKDQVVAAKERVRSLEAAYEEQKKGALETELKVARANLKRAQIEYEIAKENLANATIRAPVGGKVLAILLDPGDTVVPAIGGREGQPIMVIGNTDQIVVKGKIGERLVGKVKPGMPVKFSFTFLPEDQKVDGVIRKVSSFGQANQQGVVEFEIEMEVTGKLDQPRLGSYAKAEVITDRAEGVLALPVQAIQSNDGESYVTRQGPDGSRERVEVKTGISDGKFVEIKEGLSEGDQVVIPIMVREEEERGSRRRTRIISFR